MKSIKALSSLSFFLLTALAPVVFIHSTQAQSFQQPTPEELSMSSDPKAPGADAVYFYREETADDHYHFHGLYVRLKILTEKGKEEATVRIPYYAGNSKIADVKGRTIHSDGTVIPLNVKPADLMAFKNDQHQVNEAVFTLPDVQVGSIIEYKLDLRYPDNMVDEPEWEIQQKYFVHKAHYRFVPDKGGGHYLLDKHERVLSRLMYTPALGNDNHVKEDSQGNFTVDLVDIPASINEDWAPPLDIINWHVYFYYTYATTQQDYWQKEGSDWRKEVERFSKPNGELKGIAAGMVATGDSEDQKAHKIYAEVMKLENTDYTRHKTAAELKAEKMREVKNAEDVWHQKAGSSDDLALLYVALTNAVGLHSYPMYVSDRNRYIFAPNTLRTYQLNDYIAITTIDGKDVYVDPGTKYCAFGELDWRHLVSGGIRVTSDYKNTAIVGTPSNSYANATVQRLAEITLDETGTVSGYARYIMKGPEALRWRHTQLLDGDVEVKKQFNEQLAGQLPDGVVGEFDHFIGLEDHDANLIAMVNLHGNMGTATGKRVILPGLFFESRSKNQFASSDKREAPVDMHYAKSYQDVVNYHLPTHWKVESGPNDTVADWTKHAALRIKAGVNASGDYTVSRLLATNFILLMNTDYKDLHEFYLKVAAADQQQIVLTRSADAANAKGKE